MIYLTVLLPSATGCVASGLVPRSQHPQRMRPRGRMPSCAVSAAARSKCETMWPQWPVLRHRFGQHGASKAKAGGASAGDRHPYLEDIRGHLKVDEVSTAQGERLFPRLVELLSMPSIAAEKLVEALHTICDLCSHQESKTVAISSDVIAAATHLLMHDSVPVRRAAARVISSMALLIGGRSLLPIGSGPLGERLVEQSGPALPRLAKLLLSCDDELVKLHVAEAFQAITIFRDGCQQVVDQGSVLGITQYMCGTLPDRISTRPLALCLLRLLQTMAAVTMYAKDGMRDIFSTGFGLIGKVVKFLGNVPIDKPMPGRQSLKG
eukprot:s612_g28.t1